MKKTKNLDLNKPDYEDIANIACINENMDILDTEVDGKLSKNGGTITGATTFNAEVTINKTIVINNDLQTRKVRPTVKDTYDVGTTGYRYNGGYFNTVDTKEITGDVVDSTSGGTSGSIKVITSGAVYSGLAGKSSASHTHSLSDTTITGTLPLTKGGTGATTAANARTNLGLGTAATYGVATSVTSGSTSLVTGGAVYSTINNLNINNRTHIVVATYNTQNPLKVNADYTCTSTNVTEILRSAISSVARGGRIELLDGTFNLQYSAEPLEINKSITIQGAGYVTAITQPINAGEAKPIFKITSNDVTLKSMMLSDAVVSSPVSMIEQSAQGAIYDNIFFIYSAVEQTCDNACIEGSSSCSYSRIQNCRVYKAFSGGNKYMFNFGKCTSFGGVIGANISSGYGNISVKFANTSQKNATAIYGHSNIDVSVLGE